MSALHDAVADAGQPSRGGHGPRRGHHAPQRAGRSSVQAGPAASRGTNCSLTYYTSMLTKLFFSCPSTLRASLTVYFTLDLPVAYSADVSESEGEVKAWEGRGTRLLP